MLLEKTVKLNNPSSVSYFPILADSNEMDKDQKKKAEAQSSKVNSIISSMFDDYTVKTTQGQQTTNYTYRASSYRSQIVDRVKDACYNEFGNLSFDFYAINIKKETLTPVLRLSVENIIGNIIFVGLDDLDKPSTNLASYGTFILTKNEIANEQQLSFYAYSNVPEKIYHCSLQFIVYNVNKDVSLLDSNAETV